MASLAAGQRLKVVAMCALNDQLGLNVVWMRVISVGATTRTDANLANTLAVALAPKYTALLPQAAEYVGVSVQIMSPTLRPAVTDLSARADGILLTDPLPTQASGIITKTGDIGGRGRKGRCYVPFPAEEDNDEDGHPTASYKTRLDDLALTLLDTDITIGVAGDEAVITQIIFNPLHPLNVQDITGHVSHRKWATQRRRGDYGRTNLIP